MPLQKDSLDLFVDWYFASGTPRSIQVPADNPIMAIDGILGLTLFRFNQYQVQLFIAGPDVEVPEHTHPNVASYEVAIFGVELTHSGEVRVPMQRSMAPRPITTPWEIPVTLDYFKRLRVNPNDIHGGRSSPKGGSFMSLQEWQNGIKPTSVAADWSGPTLGRKHELHINPAPKGPNNIYQKEQEHEYTRTL